jgi:DNA-binding MarR family transcriptional regulator
MGPSTEIGSPIELFTRRMFTRIIEKLSSFLAQSDFTVSEIAALHIIDESGGLPVTAVASRLNLSVSATSRLITELERKGLLLRKEDATDSRVRISTCTKPGRKLLDQMSLERAQTAFEVITKLPTPIAKRILSALSSYERKERP